MYLDSTKIALRSILHPHLPPFGVYSALFSNNRRRRRLSFLYRFSQRQARSLKYRFDSYPLFAILQLRRRRITFGTIIP